MRSRTTALVVLVAAALTALALSLGTGPAAAHAPCADTGMPGHSDYGRSHIASHTPHGVGIPGAHNPGTHRGYSLCLGVHD
jgi:hypothetical protein